MQPGQVVPYPSRDALLRVAHIMDALGTERAEQGQFAAALSLYLLALQVCCALGSNWPWLWTCAAHQPKALSAINVLACSPVHSSMSCSTSAHGF